MYASWWLVHKISDEMAQKSSELVEAGKVGYSQAALFGSICELISADPTKLGCSSQSM
jgi:hypothetical protein